MQTFVRIFLFFLDKHTFTSYNTYKQERAFWITADDGQNNRYPGRPHDTGQRYTKGRRWGKAIWKGKHVIYFLHAGQCDAFYGNKGRRRTSGIFGYLSWLHCSVSASVSYRKNLHRSRALRIKSIIPASAWRRATPYGVLLSATMCIQINQRKSMSGNCGGWTACPMIRSTRDITLRFRIIWPRRNRSEVILTVWYHFQIISERRRRQGCIDLSAIFPVWK